MLGQITTTIGGGITATDCVNAMRIMYGGGITCYHFTPDMIPAGDGPSRFVQCFVAKLHEDSRTATIRDVLKHLKDRRDEVTYEVGLRWFLTSPGEFVRRGRIVVLPAEPMMINGKRQALVFAPGSDTPIILLVGIDLDQPFPEDWQFLTARALKPSPYLPFGVVAP